eukprot:TRINITY_DN9612_c0_g2_i2.p1 TRINITY_DN9612_c0_g2~~TRINITY_DN9612_c0_g2_i2.p1  ORF type:complete len:255 (-),score=53.72 TRINITY_DN9612_c0_g2_i2:1-765(-)
MCIRDRCTYLRRIVRRQVREDVSTMPGLGALPMESTTSDDDDSGNEVMEQSMPSHMVDVSIGDPSHEERRARKLVAESCADINSRYPPSTTTITSSTTPRYRGCKAFPAEGAYEIRERMRRLLTKEYAPEAFLWGTQHQQAPPPSTGVPKSRGGGGGGLASTTTSRSKRADRKKSRMGGGALWGSRDLGAFFDGLVPDAALLAQQRDEASSARRSPHIALEFQAHQAAHRSLFDRVYKQLNAIDGMVDLSLIHI